MFVQKVLIALFICFSKVIVSLIGPYSSLFFLGCVTLMLIEGRCVLCISYVPDIATENYYLSVRCMTFCMCCIEVYGFHCCPVLVSC